MSKKKRAERAKVWRSNWHWEVVQVGVRCAGGDKADEHGTLLHPPHIIQSQQRAMLGPRRPMLQRMAFCEPEALRRGFKPFEERPFTMVSHGADVKDRQVGD